MIRVLASEVVDRIAAGEVVERPASVVKELVENALDAQALEIVVEYSGGGVRRIEIADDGIGMGPQDALVALERHATSKITSERDLLQVGTFGFRGEALPSIAAVSRFTMLTRERGAPGGTRIRVEGGRRLEHGPAGAREGTRIRVEDLFWNTPARLKFLKTERTESVHLAEAVRSLALAHPRVRFELHRDGVEALSLAATPLMGERIAQCFGRLELHPLEDGSGPVRIEAWLSGPADARAGTSGLVLVVNGRCISDRSLAGAIAAAYEGLLPSGRWPQGVVRIDIDRTMVDVNVHPQKREVRLSDPRLVSGALYKSISRWARSTPWLDRSPRRIEIEPAIAVAAESPGAWTAAPLQFKAVPKASPPPPVPTAPHVEAPQQALPVAYGREGAYFSRLRIVGQVLGCYIVCESGDCVVLVDQHAAAERVAFERLRAQWRAGAVTAQPLLVALRRELDARRMELVEQNEGLLAALGLAVEPLGPGSVAVREVPLVLAGADPARLLDDALAELEDERGRLDSIAEHMLARMACHGSIRAGQAIDEAGARALLHSLDGIDWASHCPHGRPVHFELPRSEIERRFGRRT